MEKTISIRVKTKKVEADKVQEAFEFMLKELGEDGLCHLVNAYQDSATIKNLVKAEVATRKASGAIKDTVNKASKLSSGLLNKIKGS